MNNEIVKQEYVSPEITVTVVEEYIITESGKMSWVGPIVGAPQ